MTTEDLIDSIKTNKRVRYTGLAFKDYQNEPLEVVRVSFKGAIALVRNPRTKSTAFIDAKEIVRW